MGKKFKACFVLIDISEIADLLAFEEHGGAYFSLYVQNGGNLSDNDLGIIEKGGNILEASKDFLPQKSWEKMRDDFANGQGGNLTLSSGDVKEELCYVPVHDTGWMLVVFISESIITDQIQGISDSNRQTSRILIGVTLFSMIIFALAIILHLRKISKGRIEAEKENSRMFFSMANTDSLTGIRNKHAYSQYESLMNQHIKDGTIKDNLAVLVCDINGLKHVNDTKGHAAGDQLIKDASALICEYFKHGAVFRIGGDEFAVVLNEKGFDTLDETLISINKVIEENIQKDSVVVAIFVRLARHLVLTRCRIILHIVGLAIDIHLLARLQKAGVVAVVDIDLTIIGNLILYTEGHHLCVLLAASENHSTNGCHK